MLLNGGHGGIVWRFYAKMTFWGHVWWLLHGVFYFMPGMATSLENSTKVNFKKEKKGRVTQIWPVLHPKSHFIPNLPSISLPPLTRNYVLSLTRASVIPHSHMSGEYPISSIIPLSYFFLCFESLFRVCGHVCQYTHARTHTRDTHIYVTYIYK